MIRLVAADMDGTLLNSRGEIPAGFGDAVRALSGNGVRFAVASGRQSRGRGELLRRPAGRNHLSL